MSLMQRKKLKFYCKELWIIKSFSQQDFDFYLRITMTLNPVWCQVRYGGIRARCHVHLATVLPRPTSGDRPGRRQARHARIIQIGLPLTHPWKRVDAPSAWCSPSDLDKKESRGRDPPHGVAPHADRGVVGTHELCRWLASSLPEYQAIRHIVMPSVTKDSAKRLSKQC